jgi:large subunit ribosomal protein L28
MSAKCEMCGKGLQFGHSVSHSKHATNRSWKPNLQKVKVVQGNKEVRLRICSRCLRTMRKSA